MAAMAAVALSACCCVRGEKKSLDAQVEDILSQMTLEEKIAIIHAQSKFSSAGVPRLGIPELWTDDGPHGVRPDVLWDQWNSAGNTNDSCTAFPALTCLAATFDRELSSLYGVSVGEEARYRKKNVLLGPGVNIYRTPLGGRNFEYMGEDPYLASRMCVNYIKGVQSNGVATCVKHFCLNNQEFNRHTVNVKVDDRTLYEIYLPAFKAAVTEGGSWSIMGAYNLYDGTHLCHNSRILNDILKKEWNYDGVVISDWGGVSDTEGAVKGGLDLEFGTWTDGLTMGATNGYDRYWMANPYLEKIRSGEYGTDELDDKCRRVLKLMLRTSLYDNGGPGRFTCPEHYAAARRIGAEGIVLLKNEGGLLPIAADAAKIVVLGENAIKPMTVGGGSSSLKVQKEVSILEGIRNAFPNAEVIYERAYQGSTKGGYDNYGAYDITDERSAETLVADALKACEGADYVIFAGGLNKDWMQDAEGTDRVDYNLPYGQNEVIEALAAVRSDLVVVNVSGNAVAMPWADKVGAIIQDWYLGSEAGNSLADVLSGAVCPSGKLPFTIPVALEDGPLKTPEQYPGVRGEDGIWQEEYSEGIYVGYRWYEKTGVKPRFAFGYGLSYTSFAIGEPKLSSKVLRDKLTVTVPVENTGDVRGAEVVQLYIGADNSVVDRPVKELKGFEKVWLNPGEKSSVNFTIDRQTVSFFDTEIHDWNAEAGDYTIYIGSSSDNISSTARFSL